MEEVDKIIIDSLKHINCDLDEQITSLKDFDPDIVVAAISTCLEIMNPQLKLPKKMPVSMSARIKFASSLAEQIKEFGFKGDMGYQTILYCNEVEVRRVLMFLLERLPKESSPGASMEPIGYVPTLVKQIEDNLKMALSKMWLPSEALHYGTRVTESGFITSSFGHSCPLDSVNLYVPEDVTNLDSSVYIPSITQQCSSSQLIPSLLFPTTDFYSYSDWRKIVSQTFTTNDISKDMLHNIPLSKSLDPKASISKASKNDAPEHESNEHFKESKEEAVVNKVHERKSELFELQKVVKAHEAKLHKVKSQRQEEQNNLEGLVAKVKVKKKTLAVLSNEENKLKLKTLIQKMENRLMELADQWNEVQTPLLEEHKVLKSSASSESLKLTEHHKLQNLRKTYKDVVDDLKQKSILEHTLMERCKELNNKNNRAAYTKRILEIVGNIKKQSKDIQKILSDTRQVQKDISNLTGQVERSFTLSDETIFQDCKHDESARKAYKFLAALREECNNILQAVSDIGQAERELRNLEEQIETERSKNVREKLEKIESDLAEIKMEIQALM